MVYLLGLFVGVKMKNMLLPLLLLLNFGSAAYARILPLDSNIHQVYILGYKNKAYPLLKQDLKLVNASDTTIVKIKYNGDMGRVTSSYYLLKENLPDGIYKVFVNDTLQEQSTFVNNKKNGIQYHYHLHERSETLFYDGFPEGTSKAFYANGALKSRGLFNHGQLIFRTLYTLSGKIEANEFSANDNALRYETFDENGNLKKIVNLRKIISNTDSLNIKLNGKKIYQYAKGTMTVLYKNNDVLDYKWEPNVVK